MSTVGWRDVARKDFEDAVRSRLLWGLTFTFVALMTIFFAVLWVAEGDDLDALEAFVFLGSWSQFFVPLIALVVGYMAIVGERRSGSLRVLLSFPVRRGSIVTGKVIGRTAVVCVTILVGFVALATLAGAVLGVPPVGDALTIVGLTVLLGLTFTAVAVGISASTGSRGTAMALAVGTFFVLFVLWEALAVAAYYAVHGARPGLTVDAWYLLLRQLSPIEAFRIGLSSVAGEYVWPLVNLGLEDIPMETDPEARTVGERVDGSRPVYLQPWFTLVTFLAWMVVPLTIGYRRFTRVDLE